LTGSSAKVDKEVASHTPEYRLVGIVEPAQISCDRRNRKGSPETRRSSTLPKGRGHYLDWKLAQFDLRTASKTASRLTLRPWGHAKRP
jgi:hypothetical protein